MTSNKMRKEMRIKMDLGLIEIYHWKLESSEFSTKEEKSIPYEAEWGSIRDDRQAEWDTEVIIWEGRAGNCTFDSLRNYGSVGYTDEYRLSRYIPGFLVKHNGIAL